MADKKINGSIEITGKLNPNASGYGISIPETTSWSANKTIATTDDLTDFTTGPASSTNNTIAVFDGTTGKIIKQASSGSTSQPLRAGDLCLETSGDHLGIYTDVISMPHGIILGKQGILPTSIYSDILEISNNSAVQVDNRAQFTATQKANDGTVKSRLLFPLKGTSSTPATLATTDDIPTVTVTDNGDNTVDITITPSA